MNQPRKVIEKALARRQAKFVQSFITHINKPKKIKLTTYNVSQDHIYRLVKKGQSHEELGVFFRGFRNGSNWMVNLDKNFVENVIYKLESRVYPKDKIHEIGFNFKEKSNREVRENCLRRERK